MSTDHDGCWGMSGDWVNRLCRILSTVPLLSSLCIKEPFGNYGLETPSIKVQRKGLPQTCYIPIVFVETYEVLVLSKLTQKSTC